MSIAPPRNALTSVRLVLFFATVSGTLLGPEDEQGQFSRKCGSSNSHFGVLGVERVNGHLGTVFKKFLASIFHSEKLGSAPVQHQFRTVQPAEPLLNLTHELVHRPNCL